MCSVCVLCLCLSSFVVCQMSLLCSLPWRHISPAIFTLPGARHLWSAYPGSVYVLLLCLSLFAAALSECSHSVCVPLLCLVVPLSVCRCSVSFSFCLCALTQPGCPCSTFVLWFCLCAAALCAAALCAAVGLLSLPAYSPACHPACSHPVTIHNLSCAPPCKLKITTSSLALSAAHSRIRRVLRPKSTLRTP